MSDRVSAEEAAVRALIAWMDQGEQVRQLYQLANMAQPEPLKRYLGVSEESTKQPNRMVVPPPRPPTAKPPEAKDHWIWISAKEAKPGTLALAVLRGSPKPMRPTTITERIATTVEGWNSGGTVANAGTRLEREKLIQRAAGLWSLPDAEKAPILVEKFLWGPATVFDQHELAAHRRQAVLHLLGIVSSGLQTSQIQEHLTNAEWVKALVGKEQIQDDVERLEQQKLIRRRGHSKKWELVPLDEKGEGKRAEPLTPEQADELERQFWEIVGQGDRKRYEAWVSARRGRPSSARERFRMWQAWRDARARLRRK